MTKHILAHNDDTIVFVHRSNLHMIDQIEGKPYYEYYFVPYAAYDPTPLNQIQIGVCEANDLIFKRRELRITLLQKICKGHEISATEYISIGIGEQGGASSTIFHVDILSWKMASDKISSKDFSSFLEKTYNLDRVNAWRFAWALVRTAYIEDWPSIDNLLELARQISLSKAKKPTKAKTAFLIVLEQHIFRLKSEVKL